MVRSGSLMHVDCGGQPEAAGPTFFLVDAPPPQEDEMDGSRFDAWTRRRFGLATGGAIAAAFGLATLDAAATKRKKRRRKKRKRCVKLLRPCRVGGRKCCHEHVCQSFDTGANGTFFCCKAEGQSCTTGQPQCCPPWLCVIEAGSTVGFCGDV
jgi:hypothetical protein